MQGSDKERSGNQSVESISPGPDRGSVEHAGEDEGGQGRAASGESYEDEADEALFRPGHKHKASTTTTYDGGNLGPTGKPIRRVDRSRRP